MKNKTGCIYRIYHKESGKSYIGQTLYPERRIEQHLQGKSGCPLLNNAIRKYGRDAFVAEILTTEVPESLLNKMEMLYIHWWKSQKPFGYNVNKGGEGQRGFQPSQNTRKKMPEAKIGEPLTETQRCALETVWESNTDSKRSEETKQHMSDAKKGKKGKRHSPETRAKMSESQKHRRRKKKMRESR